MAAPVQAASLEALKHREHRQARSLHRWEGTLNFFANHPWLLRHGRARSRATARREVRHAHVWVTVIRRELADTRTELRAKAQPAVDFCLRELIRRESGWNVHATNRSSGAYGLPQALPGSKMASAGPDWHDNPATQIRWMLGYVRAYGGSCGALAFQQRNGWY